MKLISKKSDALCRQMHNGAYIGNRLPEYPVRNVRMNMKELRPRFKFWLESEDAEGFFGYGKYRLLKAIEETGSLTAAAAMLKISYRKAWGDLKKAEAGFGFKLIEKSRGGTKGGETHLTDEGRALMDLFLTLKTSLEEQAAELFAKEGTELKCD